MDVKDLRSDAVLSEGNDGIKYASNSGTVPCARKSYQDMVASPLGKVDASSARPCAVIGPDRVLPPLVSNEPLKKAAYEAAWCAENVYRHPPEYPQKLPNYQTPIRNISPRQTFQENMQRIMVPPTYNALKANEEPFPLDKNVSLSKNMKTNIPSETKYCEVPYTVSTTNNEQKHVRNENICVSNVNPVLTRTAPHGWPPNIRPPRPYGAPELYQYQEYNSCAGPRPVPMNRPHRAVHEEPPHTYPDHYSHDGNIRYKPYPTIKERYPPTRYDYIGNYSHPFHPPPSFPHHKPIHPPYAYSQVPVKYLDTRIPDALMDGYQRTGPQGNYNLQFRNQMIHPAYGPVLGNCIQNKYPCPQDGSLKTVASNKLPYETNKMYLDYEHGRSKTFPVSVSDNFYLNEIARSHHPKSQILPNYPPGNMHVIPPHPYYRKDTSTIKSYEYMPHYRNVDPSIMLSRIPSQFSPSSIAISPSDSNASNDTTQMQGNLQEDFGYVSQSPTTSVRSMDSGINRTANDFYRRYDNRFGPPIRTTLGSKSDITSNSNNTKEKKNIDVRQFLQMWNEVDDENGENSTKDSAQLHNKEKVPNQYDINKKQDQLYVLGLVNVPNEELGKYEHIQKVSKLPENIKGYNNIELLKQFEEVIESTNVSNYNSIQTSRDISYRTQIRASTSHQTAVLLPRPVSPLDVEAKISQSVIHKEVGCNFEIKPCSPKMLNVEIATPVQTVLGERTIEKITNPLIMGQSILHTEEKINCNMMNHANPSSTSGEILKIPSCKMINAPFTVNDSVKPNYSLQDLESNAGICLASLPRLDNDIELNFPEVNQQFINANKVESVITKKKDMSLNLDQPENVLIKKKENSQQESESRYELSPIIESEREFSKLSKYRKMKKSGTVLTEKDTQAHFSSSQNIRTDSVIIKNPENSKMLEQNKETADPITKLADSIQDDLNNSNMHYDNKRNLEISKNVENELKMPIAIDFSLKNENSNVKIVSPFIKDSTNDTFESNHSCSAKLPKLSSGDNETYSDLKPEILTQELTDGIKGNIFETQLLLDLRLDTDIKLTSKNVAEPLNVKDLLSHTQDKIQSSVQESVENILKAISSPPQRLLQSPVKEICEVDVLNAVPSPIQLNMQSSEKEVCEENVEKEISTTQPKVQSPEKELCEEKIFKAISSPTYHIMESPEKEINEVNVLKAVSSPTHANRRSTEKELHEDDVLNTISTPIHRHTQSPEKEIYEDNVQNEVPSSSRHRMQSEKAVCEENILNQVSSLTHTTVQSTEKEICEKNILYATSLPTITQSSVKQSCEDNIPTMLSDSSNDDQLLRVDASSNYLETEIKVKSNISQPLIDKKDEFVESLTTTEEILETSSSSTKVEAKNESNDSDMLCDAQLFTNTASSYEDTPDDQNNICNQNKRIQTEQKRSDDSYQKYDCSSENKTYIEIESATLVPDRLENVDVFDTGYPCMQTKETKNKFIRLNKELFSPWIQNLIICNEGPTNCQIAACNIGASLYNFEHSTAKLSGVEELSKSLSDKENKTTNNDTDLCNSQNITTIACSSLDTPNDDKFDSININKNKDISIDIHDLNINNKCSEIDHVIQASSDGYAKENTIDKANVPHIHFHNLDYFRNEGEEPTIEIDFKEKPAHFEYTENVSNENSSLNLPIEIHKEEFKNDIECSLGPEIKYNKQCAESIESPIQEISNKSHLKRSFSESALDRFNNDGNDDIHFRWQAKRRKKNLQNFIEPHLIGGNFCSFQSNRRNSISSMYNEENVSFCILIDNNCIITEDEGGDQEKIGYAETVNSLTNEPCSNQCDNTESLIEVMQEDNDQYSKSPTPIYSEEKSFEESWVDDIACVETVVSDDIAEDIIVSGASSPKEMCSSDNEDSEVFMTQSNHTDKVKHIYGDKMCTDDAQFLETLYRTPQMDVNKTLTSRESQIFGECNQYYNNDSLEKILSGSNNQEDTNELEALLSDSNSRSSECLQIGDTKLDKENFDTRNLSPITSQIFSGSSARFEDNPNKNDEDTVQKHKLFKKGLDDAVHSCESSTDNVFSYNHRDEYTNYTSSSSPEVSSTTSEERNPGILLKITNYKGSRISQVNDVEQENKKISCKFTEVNDYSSSIHCLPTNRPLITKGAQKYIPPLRETFGDLKIRLPLPQHSLIKLKQLKLMKNELKPNKYNNGMKKEIPKKPKPKFEDVLKSIDEMQFKMHKEKSKKVKKSIPKVVIKKNENGSHYASTANKESFNPDLTGRKWQPWVFLEKNHFIDKMVVRNKKKAIYNYRKDCYVLADKFKKYKSVGSAKFVISQPKLDDTSTGLLKCTIRLKHAL